MERRLLRAIINPAMIATWLLGLWLAWSGGWFASHWLHVKLALVILMSGVHGMLSRYVRDFAADRNRKRNRAGIIAIRRVVLVVRVADHRDRR
jgi:putative membrane protein